MASPVYSDWFFTGTLPGGSGALFTVPAGYQYVIRDMRYMNGAGWYTPLVGLQVYHNGAYLWLLRAPWVVAGKVYEWHGHHAVRAGESVFATDGDGGATMAVSGYKLTLP